MQDEKSGRKPFFFGFLEKKMSIGFFSDIMTVYEMKTIDCR